MVFEAEKFLRYLSVRILYSKDTQVQYKVEVREYPLNPLCLKSNTEDLLLLYYYTSLVILLFSVTNSQIISIVFFSLG